MYSAIEKLKAAKHYLTCQGLPGGYLECNRILNQLGDKIVALAFESGLTLQEQKN